MVIENQEQFFNEAILRIKDVTGVDTVYFLSSDEILKEHHNSSVGNYIDEVKNIIKSNPAFNTDSNLSSEEFHTCSFLNESGLIIISKLVSAKVLYMVIIAGENDPVDLLNLLKICKEIRQSFQNSTVTNV